MDKVSFVCTTYRRFRCVQRIVDQYYAQTYVNKELIIFNTDIEHPIHIDYLDDNIVIVNNAIDYTTNLPYTNRGSILTDAIRYASGDYFMLADDDDIYLPWHIQQAVDGINKINKDAWKPDKSLFAVADRIELCKNTLEASVIVKMNRIREIGFRTDITGLEGLSWYSKLKEEGNLDENNLQSIPSYCFNWSDPSDMAGHKQSGNINHPDNFENHKKYSNDIATKALVKQDRSIINSTYNRYFDWLKCNKSALNAEYYNTYAKPFTEI